MMNANQLLERLKRQNDSQFEELLLRLQVDTAHLRLDRTTQATKAIDLIRYLEQQEDGLKRLQNFLEPERFSETAAVSCPYQGLSAFQEEHAEFFFGRDRFIDRLVKDVQAKPLVAVIGSSGSGKSSLVFAGLMPRLRKSGDWLIESFRPKNQPFDALAGALIHQLEPDLGKTDQVIQSAKLAKALQSGELSLQQVISQIEGQRSHKLLLIADQFEELYTLCPESDRIPFIDVLLAGVKDIAGFKLVLTLRADFCEQAYKYELFTNALQDADLKLSAMNREDLQLAIECPATLTEILHQCQKPDFWQSGEPQSLDLSLWHLGFCSLLRLVQDVS